MGFNLGSMIGGAISGGLTGGPAGAAVGALGGALGGGGINPGSDGTLNAQKGINSTFETAELGLSAENMRHNLVMQTQSTMFNEVMDQKSELMRETNTLRDVAMSQRSADISVEKEFIKTIKE